MATAIALSWIATPGSAGVQGTVRNATTGTPASGVMLTLSTFQGGMRPLEETVSGADGKFFFQKDLPAVTEAQPFAGAIRAEHEGVNYTEILPNGAASQNVSVTVYSTSAENTLPPADHVGHPRAGRKRNDRPGAVPFRQQFLAAHNIQQRGRHAALFSSQRLRKAWSGCPGPDRQACR